MHSNSLTLTPITTSVGAILGGIDMREEPSPQEAAFVRQALVEHGVVLLRGQDISLDQFWAYLQHFGIPLKDETSGQPDDTADMVMTADMSFARHGTAVWHADTTSLARPPWATALRAVSPPDVGGDTCWSSMYAAWAALSPRMQAMLDGLTAVHVIDLTYERMAHLGPGFQAQYDPLHPRQVVHPLVLTHPETGRKALYVSESFVTRIVELSPQESAAVLAMLFRHVESPDFCMRWKWSANDVAFWDNRAVQHYAVPDYESERVMQRIVMQGGTPGEAAPRGNLVASAG